MSQPYEAFLENILRKEGGYVNNPNDAGGATNMGITQRTFTGWATKFKPEWKHLSVRDLTVDQAKEFYRSRLSRANFPDDPSRFLPLFSWHSLAESRAISGLRKGLAEALDPADLPAITLAATKTFDLSDGEVELLQSMSPRAVQIITLFSKLSQIIDDVEADIKLLRRTQTKSASDIPAMATPWDRKNTFGPHYIRGWINRAFDKQYRGDVPLKSRIALAKWATAELLRLAEEAQGLYHPLGGDGWIRLKSRVTDVMNPFFKGANAPGYLATDSEARGVVIADGGELAKRGLELNSKKASTGDLTRGTALVNLRRLMSNAEDTK